MGSGTDPDRKRLCLDGEQRNLPIRWLRNWIWCRANGWWANLRPKLRTQQLRRRAGSTRGIQQLSHRFDPKTIELSSSPFFVATMANSPVVANAYLGFSQAMSTGTLPARLREQLALIAGETNDCEYCVAAHTALGKGAGLSEGETCDARRAVAADDKERAALEFVRTIVTDRGNVSDDDVDAVRQTGYTDGEIGEIVANVALNILTNYFNHMAGTEVDFPAAPELVAA